MRLYTWDKEGKRIHIDSTYEPYLYVETSLDQYDASSIFNTRLRKKKFDTSWNRSQYLDNSGLSRVYENFSVQQQFLLDAFWDKNEDPDFTKFPLKIHFTDIEAVPEGETFSSPHDPVDPINVITTYDSLSKKYYVFGTKPYSRQQEDLIYVYCKTEKELLEKYLTFFENDRPEILSGWNFEGYDMPYIINRIKRILGEDQAKRLSPTGKIRTREFMGKFGKMQLRWYIDGVSCIDYLEIYRRFCPVLRDSYKLGNIGEIELDESKVDFGDTDLATLAADNWDVFVDYNIQDVRLLVKLEEKLRYIALLRMIAYFGLVPFESALGSVGVFIGMCACEARRRNQCIPTFAKHKEDDKEEAKQNAGAYVAEPKRGFQECIVTYDANSLYPNTMISLNLSPETKIGKIIKRENDEVTIRHINGQEFKLSNEKFLEFIKSENIAISKAEILFSQKEKGIIPAFIDKLYQQRVAVKDKHKKLKKQLAKLRKEDNQEKYLKIQTEVDRLDILQYTIKIIANASYGVLGNKHNPMGDDELAESITLTGQAVIKESNNIIIQFIKNKINKSEFVLEDPVTYNDTDSCHISLKDLAKQLDITVSRDSIITPEFYTLVEEAGNYLNQEILKWGRDDLNSADCRFEFKREKICDVAFYLQKKRYVLHVLDEEGIPKNEYKYTGVEVVRTTMPKPIKPHVKRVIEVMMSTRSIEQTNKSFVEVYDIYKKLPIEDIALISGISGYEKYVELCKIYRETGIDTKDAEQIKELLKKMSEKKEKETSYVSDFTTVKRMPRHVKSAYFYNMFIDKLGLQKRHEKIGSGDKVRFFYIEQPNRFGLNSIGFKYSFPKEFVELFKPDYELMFEKVIFEPINRFYEAAGWKLQLPRNTPQTDLFELLGI